MPRNPDEFVFKKEREIVPKRVEVVLNALDPIFAQFNIDVPGEIDLEGPNRLSVEQASEEEVAAFLNEHLKQINEIIEQGESEDTPRVVDRVNGYVQSRTMFLAFLSKARTLAKEKKQS